MSAQPSAPQSADRPLPESAPGRRGAQASSGMDALTWITVALAVTSGLAMAAMLITKWVVGGGEIWPWFTRYALVAFPLSVILMFVLLVRNAIRRART